MIIERFSINALNMYYAFLPALIVFESTADYYYFFPKTLAVIGKTTISISAIKEMD